MAPASSPLPWLGAASLDAFSRIFAIGGSSPNYDIVNRLHENAGSSRLEREVDGQGFTALYQNFLETQVATLALRVRF